MSAAFDWKPDAAEVRVWSLVGAGVFLLGVPLFAGPSLMIHRGISIRVGLVELVAVVALTVLLGVVHEALHAAVMAVFRVSPKFGVTLVAGFVPAFFTTAPGHGFTRLQYVAVAAAPALILSAVGLSATLASWGPYLVVPLAAHLAGCVGDGAAIWRVTQQPTGTICEDLRDGVRFHPSSGFAGK